MQVAAVILSKKLTIINSEQFQLYILYQHWLRVVMHFKGYGVTAAPEGLSLVP